MKTIYECSQSKGVKWFTIIFFCVIFIAILLEIIYVSRAGEHSREATVLSVALTILLGVIPVSCFLVFPQYIIADDEGIGIRTLARTIRIPYGNIDHIERLGGEKSFFGAFKPARIVGVGGIFGWVGWFRTKDIGTFRSYVRDGRKAFMVYRTKGRPIAISVNEPEEFLPYYLKGGTK